MLALENIDVLRQNGFEIEVDENPNAEDSRQLKLLSIPVSKSTVFGVKGESSVTVIRNRF
jgi:DNA mismatch repair protein PMS2